MDESKGLLHEKMTPREKMTPSNTTTMDMLVREKMTPLNTATMDMQGSYYVTLVA